MLRHRTTIAIGSAALVALAFTAGFAVGQANPPTQTRGFTAVDLRSLDLTDEIDSVAKRSLRIRKITLEPGGMVAPHNHKDRPTVGYILQGSVTYHPEGKPEVVVSAGEPYTEGRATNHWAENRGTVPAVWLAVDISK
jgi:quercetin dioxygenase-like cupin family protein